MELKLKNPKYNKNGDIDIEWDHPKHGLIIFTASKNDVEEHGRIIFKRALNGEYGIIV